MTVLPEPPAASAAGQAINPLTDAVIRAAIDNALHEARRDETAPPPAKRERPAMSGKATDDSVRMIAFGGMILMVSAGGGILMVASDFADPTVIGMICAAPAAIAIPVLAAARLARRLGEGAPTTIEQTYTGPVRQETTVDQRRAVWQKNISPR